MYSMTVFADLIFPALELAGAKQIVEIGADTGGMSRMLAEYCRKHGGEFASVDPAPTPDFRIWAAFNPKVRHLAMPSLAAFAELENIDAWIIDGDHNWYTVYHELTGVEKVCRRDGKPVLAFFHDVAWPCARRDMYYAPERIPSEYRQPFSRDNGITLGNPGLLESRGLRGGNHFAWAEQEGGPRNGVLTAIEDFMAERYREGREFGFAEIPGVMGLGVLFDLDTPWSAALANLLMPFHHNQLLRLMEEDRLRSTLRAHDLQDAAAEAKARMAIATGSHRPSIRTICDDAA
jgi:Methyltransferase domain